MKNSIKSILVAAMAIFASTVQSQEVGFSSESEVTEFLEAIKIENTKAYFSDKKNKESLFNE